MEDLHDKHCSGLTSRLVLEYVEREGGRAAVDAVLAHAGLGDHEALLRDESSWFSWSVKTALFDAGVAVLGDAELMRHVGLAALELEVGAGMKVAVRALGTPGRVYRLVAVTTGKFSWTHRMELLAVDDGHAVLRYRDLAGVGHHQQDCLYNAGLLTAVPQLFGLPRARLVHDECALRGAEACVYDLTWTPSAARPARAMAAGIAGSGALAAALAVGAPAAAMPLAAAPVAAAGVVAYRRGRARARSLVRSLRAEVREQRALTERLAVSLSDTVSDLRLDEVLDKVARNAQTAVGGKDFVLLVTEPGGGGLRVRSAPGTPLGRLGALETWAERAFDDRGAGGDVVVVRDLAAEPALASLLGEHDLGYDSLCAVPLRFAGEPLGVLVGLGHGPEAFLPGELGLLRLYAAQAAMALRNAYAMERLAALAREDGLTGLLCHRELHERLGSRLAGGEELAVVLVDLDGFKAVNDHRGHARGDEVLRRVAGVLRAECGPADEAFRVGGDEFALVLAGGHDAPVRAAAVREAVRALGAGVAASTGVALAPSDASDKDDLLGWADAELYAAKPTADGRPDRRRALLRGGVAAELRAGIARGELVLHFQPKVAVAGGALIGAEVLVRWAHPTRGLLAPGAFLPAAARGGLLPAITERVLDGALAQVAAWRAAGHEVPVAVNASLPDVLDEGFPATVAAQLARHDVPARLLSIELTEDLVMTDAERVGRVLDGLRALGVELALDDFGTGRASLAHLKALPVRELKIDRSFVGHLAEDAQDAAIVRSTVALAHALGLRAVAEGVEDADALAALAACGCDVVQGFHLGRPVPAAELAAVWLAAPVPAAVAA